MRHPRTAFALVVLRAVGCASNPAPEGFLVPAAHSASAWLAVVMSAQLEQARMITNRRPQPLQHRGLEVVVEHDSGHAREVGEGSHVPAQEVLLGLVEEKLQVERAREG